MLKWNKEKFVYNKRYVPADELEYNYQKIAITYTNPSASFNVVLVSLYFAFALSILLFTFRVTSGRNWLITLISLGIFNVLLAIITAMRSTGFIYMIGISLLTLALAIYFVIVLIRKTKKGVSAIALNGLLWLSPSFIPIIYNLILMISRDIYPHNYDYFKYYQEHPTLKWMNDNIDAMAWANLLFVVLVILILSFKIKKWKGIAEN